MNPVYFLYLAEITFWKIAIPSLGIAIFIKRQITRIQVIDQFRSTSKPIQATILVTLLSTTVFFSLSGLSHLKKLKDPLHAIANLSFAGINNFNEKQENILIIGVEDLNTNFVTVEGVWYALFLRDTPHVTLLPVFPEIGKQNSDLAFETNGDNQELINQITGEFQIDRNEWTHWIILDLQAINLGFDMLGGISAASLNGNGLGTSNLYQSTISSKNPQIIKQVIGLEFLCQQDDRTITSEDLLAWYHSVYKNMITDMEINLMVQIANDLLAPAKDITCEFPTIQEYIFTQSAWR